MVDKTRDLCLLSRSKQCSTRTNLYVIMKAIQYLQTLIFGKRKNEIRLRGSWNISNSSFKWKFPNFYQEAGCQYRDQTVYRHRDDMDREFNSLTDDRYISCYDGKIKKLVVQTTDKIYDSPGNSTWRRTYIRNVSPLTLRIANWPFSHVDYRKGGLDGDDVPLIALKWLGAVVGIAMKSVLLVFFVSLGVLVLQHFIQRIFVKHFTANLS